MKPEILLIEPMMQPIEARLDDAYSVHRLFLARDRAALIKKIAPCARAIVTGGATGASNAIVDTLTALEIIAINGNRIPKSGLDELLTQFKPGTAIQLTVARDGRLREIPITLGLWPADVFKLVKIENASDRQKRLFKSWTASDF